MLLTRVVDEAVAPDLRYAAGGSFSDFLQHVRHRHPFVYDLIDERFKLGGAADVFVRDLNSRSWEFEDDASGGRGAMYNVAQKASRNRQVGMTFLLNLFREPNSVPVSERIVLDALAGDGTIRRFAGGLVGPLPHILSADIAQLMIDSCAAQDLPYVRQSASRSLLRDASLDGILIAYGSHHLAANERLEAAAEAYRTLRVGGRFVLHDFEVGGPVDAWFGTVVHPFSATGHPHPHFTRVEMNTLLTGAGFADARVFAMRDPITTKGPTPAAARRNLLAHLHAMYGLSKLPLATPTDDIALEQMVERSLGPIVIGEEGDSYTATAEREALVAVGTK